MDKKPIRMCAVCKARKPKNELIKVVKLQDGSVQLDLNQKINGRSLYLCQSKLCIEKAQKSNILTRSLGQGASGIYEELNNAIKD